MTQRRTGCPAVCPVFSNPSLAGLIPSRPFSSSRPRSPATGRVVRLVASRSLPGVAPLSAPPGNPDGDVPVRPWHHPLSLASWPTVAPSSGMAAIRTRV
jgi:hypothetical protein